MNSDLSCPSSQDSFSPKNIWENLTFAGSEGEWMYGLAEELFPICRSLTGSGVRETLNIIKRELPSLKIVEVPSGKKVFDWEVPNEWNIRDAYIKNSDGERVIDFRKCNLHVVGYSVPVKKKVSRAELEDHLYSLPDMPTAIPYVTSYYKERWGFCLSEDQRASLLDAEYEVCIDSDLSPGSLSYGELMIPGESKEEVFLSTYVCHPSMGNNELSGPVVATCLAKYLSQQSRRYTYRIIFIPERIGAITYLSTHLRHLKENVIAGYNISCVGDNLAYSYIPSRNTQTLSDRVAVHVLDQLDDAYRTYSFLDGGSDERSYCAPGVDLPIASILRTRYGSYPEYHTSLDNLDFISPAGLFGAYKVLRQCLESIEMNRVYVATQLCEPQMGKRGLYPTLGTKGALPGHLRKLIKILAYCDGKIDLLEVATAIKEPVYELAKAVETLLEHDLIEEV